MVVMFILFDFPVRKLVSAIGNKGMSFVCSLDMHQENTVYRSWVIEGNLSALYTISVCGR
jgi:hypothetical protein